MVVQMSRTAKKPNLLLPKTFVQRQIWAGLIERQRNARDLKKTVSNLIQKHYPEHLFQVEVEEETGSIFIDHPLLAHSVARYFCRYNDYVQSDGKIIVKLCGEMLERVGVARGELKYFEDYEGRTAELAKTQFKAK